MTRLLGVTLGGLLLVATGLAGAIPAAANTGLVDDLVHRFDHIVVIYQENHSFDNLYGGWGRVGFQRVNGLARADPAKVLQVAQDGSSPEPPVAAPRTLATAFTRSNTRSTAASRTATSPAATPSA